MRRLKRHPFFVTIRNNEMFLCPIIDYGPHMFAGGFMLQAIPVNADVDLILDIAETLKYDEAQVRKMIETQSILKKRL